MITSPTPWTSIQQPKQTAILDRNGICIATFLDHRDADLVLAMVNGTSPLTDSVTQLEEAVHKLERKIINGR